MERIGGNQKEYEEYEYNKLNLVTGKVQSGKTAVCIQSIIQDQNENNIDLLFTMNSMSASSQFISRVKSSNIEPESIIVFNSDNQKESVFLKKGFTIINGENNMIEGFDVDVN